MQKPKVSVIMAVYNGEKTISSTINSILSQTFGDFEFIIVDDASTDRTSEILREYVQKDRRVKVIRNTINKERCLSRNIAIEKSLGEYVAITDADDVSFTERFSKQVEYLNTNKEVYLVGARGFLVDNHGQKIGKSWGKKYDTEVTEILKERNVLIHSSVMFRNTKEFWYRDKFIKYAEDYDLFLQMIKCGNRLVLLGDFLVAYLDIKDIKFNEYIVNQRYMGEVSRKILRNEISYEDFDNLNLEKYIPENLKNEMKLKSYFFDGEFKKSREYSLKLIKTDKSLWWKLFYLDSFFRGLIIKIGKILKRLFFI